MTYDWQQLRQLTLQCTQCALCQTRTNVVFGDGALDAEILFVGEGPGEQEDRTGVPFVGPAGKFLDEMLCIIDLDRTKYYIANIVKCRPPHNRDPADRAGRMHRLPARADKTTAAKDYCLSGAYCRHAADRPEFQNHA